jgi:hypothetical protein
MIPETLETLLSALDAADTAIKRDEIRRVAKAT